MSNNTTPPPGISPAVWELLVELPNGCYKDLIPGVQTSYGYKPTLAAGIVFCVAFGIALAGHLVQFARFRRWSSILFAIGALSKQTSNAPASHRSLCEALALN